MANPNPVLHLENLTNAGKGRPKGSKNKVRFNDVITDERIKTLLEELYTIATTDKYAKNRIVAATYLLDREYGRVPAQVTVTNDNPQTLKDLLGNNNAQDTTDNE